MYRTQGLDVQISVKALAGCGPSEERKRTIPVMEFPARNDRHATQVKTKMQRGKACLISKIYMQEMLQEAWLRPSVIAITILRDSRFSLCHLCVLCVSVVIGMHETTTTETQRTQRLHKEKKGRPPTASPSKCDDGSLVCLLPNESWDVEIVNARSTHHRPWEIISRPCYITWWRRGNRCCCSGRRN
jgi:hypothetical protein